MRKKLSKEISDKLLVNNKHICCICHEKGKDVQIHHIDGNPNKNTFSNLAVVCLDCHSKITGKRGLGRSYSQGEISLFKKKWEHYVKEELSIKNKIIYKETISQIDLIICKILAIDNNKKRIDEEFKILEEMSIYFGNEITEKILESYKHLSLMAGLNSKEISIRLLRSLNILIGYFPGPEELKLKIIDKRNLISAARIIGTIGDFGSEYIRDVSLTKEVHKTLAYFLRIAEVYKFKELIKEIADSAKISNRVKKNQTGDNIFDKLVKKCDKLLK